MSQTRHNAIHSTEPKAAPAARLEWLQLWAGADCDTEWFDIAPEGISSTAVPGVHFRATPVDLHASSETEELRLRAVIHVPAAGPRLSFQGIISPGSEVLLRDAFGREILQAIHGSPSLTIDLGMGRFAVEARLLPKSSISVELLRATARRARQTRQRSVG
jgi:hypothetical protein